jgi:hypothetical protein
MKKNMMQDREDWQSRERDVGGTMGLLDFFPFC